MTTKETVLQGLQAFLFMLCPRCPCQYFQNKVQGGLLEGRLKRKLPVRALQQRISRGPMRSALFSTWGLLSGTPPDARGPQAGRSAANAHPGFPPRQPLLGLAPRALAQAGCSAWAPKLGLRRLPRAASPTFSRQEGGRRRAFPVVH